MLPLASRRRPSRRFLPILSKKFMKEISGFLFLSQISRIFSSNCNFVFIEKSIFRGESLPLTLDAALNVSVECFILCVCVCTVNVTLPENHPLVLTYARLLITFPSPIRRGRQSDFVKDRRHRKTSGLSGPSI